jgi:[acyl-carrier-protein] S-malonyltransferase
VLSGSKIAIERALEIAKAKGAKRAILLPVSGAFHSLLMKDAQEKMAQALEKTIINQPIVPLVANVSAQIIQDPLQIKNLLIEQITGSVRWRETMLCFEQNGIEEVIEFGAGKVLSGLVSRTCPNLKSRSIQNSEDLKNFNLTL